MDWYSNESNYKDIKKSLEPRMKYENTPVLMSVGKIHFMNEATCVVDRTHQQLN